MAVPLRALTVGTSLFTCKYSQVYHFSNHRYFCTTTHGAETHIRLFLCERSQLEPLCVHANTHKYTFFKSHTSVYKPNVCNLTYVCVLASAHTCNLFVYMHISTNIHISYDGHFCTRTHGAETRIWLCPCERSQLEPLCVHANTHKYAFFRSQVLLYTNPMCATSHMSVRLRVLTVTTSLYTCIYPQIYRMMHTCIYSQACKCCIMNTFAALRSNYPRLALKFAQNLLTVVWPSAQAAQVVDLAKPQSRHERHQASF